MPRWVAAATNSAARAEGSRVWASGGRRRQSLQSTQSGGAGGGQGQGEGGCSGGATSASSTSSSSSRSASSSFRPRSFSQSSNQLLSRQLQLTRSCQPKPAKTRTPQTWRSMSLQCQSFSVAARRASGRPQHPQNRFFRCWASDNQQRRQRSRWRG